MGGGVNPIEWVLPPVALTHLAVDKAASLSGNPIPGVPGSETDKAQKLGELADQKKQEAVKSAADYLAANPLPQTPEEEEAARKRGLSAQSSRPGGKRASQYLAESSSALGV